jgi:O-antigen ligase
LLLPSVYIATRVLFNRNFYNIKVDRKGSIIIICAFLLSFSLVGYFGLFLIILSFSFAGVKIKIKQLIFFLAMFTVLIYFILQTSLGYKISSFLYSSNDIVNTQYTSSDQTTFALLSNFLVAKQALLESNYIGYGLNSHQISYTKNITNIFSVTNIPNELNKENAGSLFLRVMSEFGIPGIFILFFLLFKYKCKIPSANGSINALSLIFLITYMLRTGHYISNVFVFFFAIYIYSKKNEEAC